jgi:hypothetical protein
VFLRLLPLLASVICVFLCVGAMQLAYAGWQNTPDTLTLEPMGTEMMLNGTPMQIRMFSSNLPFDVLLKQVEEAWSRGVNHAAVTRTKISNWTVLNQTLGDEHRSFQVRESGPTQLVGYVALTSPARTVEPKMAFKLPAGMSAVSITESRDPGSVSQQVMVFSTRSIDTSADVLESTLKIDGWLRYGRAKKGDSILFSANKGEQELDATFQAQKNGALAMINVVTKKK